MINSEKKIQELALKLNDSNATIVIAAIDSLRNHDPFPGAIKLLANLYDTSEIMIIRDHIRSFMNDLKESSVRAEVIAEICGTHDSGTLAMLVSSCWQSGLDYSSWAKEIIVLFCKSDYATALECFTVLEESSHALPAQKKKELTAILKENENLKIPEKTALFRELISILY
jgi:hypothetical protein